MLGSLRLYAARGKYYRVHGGSYFERPKAMSGIRLAAELAHLPADVVVPIKDFSVPITSDLHAGLDAALSFLIDGKPVYVGCAGGRGRTGLFLSALAKLWGYSNPIDYVRREYFKKAVETSEQEAYISSLEFPYKLRMKTAWAKARGLWSAGSNLNSYAFFS